MNYCANCAAPLPPSADFCPKCGKSLRVPVAPPAAPGVPAAPIPAATMTTTDPSKPVKRRAPWWIVPLVIVGLVVIAFLVLLGLPFGGREGNRPASAPKVETIAEADPVPPRGPAQTGTVVDVSEDPEVVDAPPAVAVSTQPPARTPPSVRTPPPVRTQPPPVRTEPPAVRTQPPPARTTPAPAAAEEISVSDAMATLRSFITSRDYYGSGADCIGVSSLGYRNTGYTLEVRNTCSSRTLGRWRVDSKTREIFRQHEDGRYLRP